MPWATTELRFEHRIVGGHAIRRASPDATDFYPNPRMLLALAQTRCDVVISGGFSFPSLYAAAYRALTRRRLLIHSDGTARSEASIGRGQQLTRAVLARVADGGLGNSRQAAERFQELGFRRVFEAPHSTVIEPFISVGKSRDYATSGTFRLITAGRLIPRKGVDRLLRAVAAARSKGVAIRLTSVGSGEEESRLRALAAELGLDDTEWVGFVQQRDLPALFADADAFAFPTLDDPFGIVLLEAAAAGLPLIASPHGGATEDLVTGQGSGVVVDPDDADAFAAALAELAADPGMRERMGRAAHAVAAQRTPEETADAYVRAARAVLP